MTLKPALFDQVDPGEVAGAVPLIQPWRVVPLDPDYSGAWVIAGDVNGDGQVEIVSARNVNVGDIHYTSAVVAQDLDGRVLWRWGDPRIGRRGLHHDVACQIHDWDNDGHAEVILCTAGFLVEIEGATGAERRRLPLPPDATDCLVFADLAGRGWASDVLVKTRYSQIWALDHSGRLLWTVQKPGGFPTAHQPMPVDLDGDGRDEILAGYAMLNPDGQVRWALPGDWRFTGSGHLDCGRVLRRGSTPAECQLVVTCCAHHRLVAMDGTGRVCWEVTGHHFESIDIGRISPERPGLQMLVDLVPPADGHRNYPLWVVNEDGELLGQLLVDYGRFHTLADWNGDGLDELVVPHTRGLFDCRGERIATFAMPPQADVFGGQPREQGEIGHIVLRGDMSGGGGPDLLLTGPDAVYVFRNEKRRPELPASALGTGTNFTLY